MSSIGVRDSSSLPTTADLEQQQKRQQQRKSPEGREREFPATRIGNDIILPGDNDDDVMGSGDDRYYHPAARCPGGGGGGGAQQLAPSRDFHFTLPDHYNYSRRQMAAAAAVPAAASVGYNPVAPTAPRGSNSSSRRDNGYYVDKGSSNSPYHHGGSSRRMRTREQENYLLLREAAHRQQQQQQQQQQQADYLQHRSGSRQDLLDHDHNSIYDQLAFVASSNPQQYSFVRTPDGKFVRTTLPMQDVVMDYHTIRRPRAKPSNNSSSNNTDFNGCCPRNEHLGGGVSQQQQQNAYATLRGRKPRNGCNNGGGGGVGDNYGHNFGVRYPMVDMEEDLLPPPPHHETAANLLRVSRSTDAVVGEDELMMMMNPSAAAASAAADEVLLLQKLLPREPPDGKEKPEPSKQQHKLELLSRKNSKCDLLLEGLNSNSSRAVSSSASDAGASDNASVLSFNCKGAAAAGDKRDSLTAKDSSSLMVMSSDNEVDSGMGSSVPSGKDWKTAVPGSPHIISSSSSSTAQQQQQQQQQQQLPPNASISQPSFSSSTSLTGVTAVAATNSPKVLQGCPVSSSVGSANVATAAGAAVRGSSIGARLVEQAEVNSRVSFASAAYGQMQLQQQSVSSGGVAVVWHQVLRRYVIGGAAKFFGVDEESESKTVWADRRRRLAIKRFGGIKDSEFPIDGSAYSSQYVDGGCGSRLRYDHHLTSELEGEKMVLKITKPPRSKDSLSSLTGQGFSWMLNSLMTRKVPVHQIVTDHELSRSYEPSATGIAAYYQAEQAGGLAVCPPPLPRVNSSHLLHGESPAEEVFFTKPSCDGDDLGGLHGGKRIAYSSDQYRPYNWQRPQPDQQQQQQQQQQQHSIPRMSSDVGASRIWNRLLDAAFDNSDRRKHGMGAVGRAVSSRKRARRRNPESNRKRKLGGNAADHRPFFTYWITMSQILVLAVAMAAYGVGPVGVDLYKKAGMVLVTNLELEPVGHLEPANFWIGPSATALIHLGAKYAPCMRWDEALDRDIKEERLKERDTACCIRKDRAGCVQSPKAECSKVGETESANSNGGNGGSGAATPRSNWWRPSEWYSKYPNENRRSSGPVCGLDPAYCEAPASVAPYIWPDDITKWPICRRKTDVDTGDNAPNTGLGHHHGQTAEHMICEIIGHPCCIGIRGQCKITTKEYCLFVGGAFHDEAALCSQVSCLDDVCGLLPFRNRDVPDQFYRTWTPLFLHAGVIHLAITVSLQYWLMRDLEKLAGAGRIAIIYMGSGMVGNLASAIFVPYRAEVGPSGAHFGLLACSMVEVIHQWPTLRYPEMAILKLIGVTSVLFLCGLLPWVDNYAHLFGFIFGFLLSYALLPFVTLGGGGVSNGYDRKKKVVLVWVCLASAALLVLGLLLLFYVTPIHDCEVCKYFNCIPITKDFCADQNIDLRPEVV